MLARPRPTFVMCKGYTVKLKWRHSRRSCKLLIVRVLDVTVEPTRKQDNVSRTHPNLRPLSDVQGALISKRSFSELVAVCTPPASESLPVYKTHSWSRPQAAHSELASSEKEPECG